MAAVVVVVPRVTGASDGVEAVGSGRAAADPLGVAPDIGGQVGMGVVDAGVHYADYYAAGASRDVPGRNRVDVRSRGASGPEDRLAGVPQSPQVGEARVIGDEVGVQDVVGLGVADRCPPLE